MRSDRTIACRLAFLARLGCNAALALGVVAAPAYAAPPCQFDRPMGSSSGSVGTYSTTLMQAYVSCNNPGGNVPNATTVTGVVPSCAPPETFHQQSGSPANGWRFSQNPGSGSYGKVYMKRTTAGPNLPGFPQTQRDLYMKLTLRGIVSGGNTNNPATGNGSLLAVVRITTEDYENGPMTVIDFPLSFVVPMNNGSATVVKKLGDLLIDLGQPRLPDCSLIEVVSISIRDPNGDVLAVPGIKLRDR